MKNKKKEEKKGICVEGTGGDLRKKGIRRRRKDEEGKEEKRKGKQRLKRKKGR